MRTELELRCAGHAHIPHTLWRGDEPWGQDRHDPVPLGPVWVAPSPVHLPLHEAVLSFKGSGSVMRRHGTQQ